MIHIDHTTLRTRHLEETKDFFIAVFGLKPGSRPAVIEAGIPGYWLYWQDAPLVHLIQSSPFYQTPVNYAAEAIDHTAFYMEDYAAFRAKLTAMNIPFSLMDLPDIGERRIFLHTPTGILLETVFREAVA